MATSDHHRFTAAELARWEVEGFVAGVQALDTAALARARAGFAALLRREGAALQAR
jgi:hypothetical protein